MIAYLFIILGLVFIFFGTLGIIRFPDIYTRLQTSSKCDAAGAVALLVGLMVREGLDSLSLRILLILVFLLLTNPVATCNSTLCCHQRDKAMAEEKEMLKGVAD